MDSGPRNARIMIVGDVPGVEEIRAGVPFVGVAGQELTRILSDAGIDRSQCFFTNVTLEKPVNNDFRKFFEDKGCKKPGPEIVTGLKRLHALIEEVQPELIITLGNLPLWGLHEKLENGKAGVGKWRGSQLHTKAVRYAGPLSRTFKVLPTWHPTAILRNWEWRYTAVHDLRRSEIDAGSLTWKDPEYTFITRPSYSAAATWLENLRSRLETTRVIISCDLETRGGYIACVGLADSATNAICIPLMCIANVAGYWAPDEEFQLVLKMREILMHKNARVVGQNFLYDLQYIAKEWGIAPYPWLDTMLAHHLCWPGMSKGLDFLSSLYCQFHRYWKDEGKHWDPRIHTEDEYWVYNCKDAVAAWEIAQQLDAAVLQLGLTSQFEFQQYRIYKTMFRVMLRGVKVNKKLRAELTLELMQAVAMREQYINTALNRNLNPRSPIQLQEFFYWQLQLPPQRTKEGGVTCDEDALNKLKKKEPLITPIVDYINEVRSLGTAISVCSAELDTDGRMRTSYGVAGPETFRFSSSENAFGSGTNLQNISSGKANKIASWLKRVGPKSILEIGAEFKKTLIRKDETEAHFYDRLDDLLELSVRIGQIQLLNYHARIYGYGLIRPNLRRLLIPDTGKIIIDVDLDRADLQVVVWEADDTEMKQMLREGVDMHKENAKILFNLQSVADVTNDQRQVAKIFCHATNYGGKARTVGMHCGLSVAATHNMQMRWLGAHPGIKTWHENTEADLIRDRTVTNAFGYRRYYFDRIDTILPEALAWKPQSTVAIVINKGIVNVDERMPGVETLLQVHDSGTFQTDISNWPKLWSEMEKNMLIEVPYADPLTIGVGCMSSTVSWGDCE